MGEQKNRMNKKSDTIKGCRYETYCDLLLYHEDRFRALTGERNNGIMDSNAPAYSFNRGEDFADAFFLEAGIVFPVRHGAHCRLLLRFGGLSVRCAGDGGDDGPEMYADP